MSQTPLLAIGHAGKEEKKEAMKLDTKELNIQLSKVHIKRHLANLILTMVTYQKQAEH